MHEEKGEEVISLNVVFATMVYRIVFPVRVPFDILTCMRTVGPPAFSYTLENSSSLIIAGNFLPSQACSRFILLHLFLKVSQLLFPCHFIIYFLSVLVLRFLKISICDV